MIKDKLTLSETKRKEMEGIPEKARKGYAPSSIFMGSRLTAEESESQVQNKFHQLQSFQLFLRNI